MSAPIQSGSEFLINTTIAKDQENPSVVALANGKFVVTWVDDSLAFGDASGSAIVAQVFNADGSKSGSEFLVNTVTTNNQVTPRITALDNGNFVITWSDQSKNVDGDPSDPSTFVLDNEVRAQIFDA